MLCPSVSFVKKNFSFSFVNLALFYGCCNNCPRDDSPRRQLSKGLLSNDTVVQGDYCPMGLLSKKAFASEKLAKIDFSYFLLQVAIFIDYKRRQKSMWAALTLSAQTLDKSGLGLKYAWTTGPWTKVSLDNESLDIHPLNNLLFVAESVLVLLVSCVVLRVFVA